MPTYTLVPHRDFPDTAIRGIEVDASRAADGRLDLDYRIAGAVDRVLWPVWKAVERADDLWQHSCVEAFVGASGKSGYAELNFATSGQWAAYAFSGHRAGMQPIDDVLIGGGRTFGDHEVRLRRSVYLPDLAGVPEWRVGLSAVIEMRDGALAYWALAHPPGKPDFHHEVCFAARLAAPERA